MGDVPNDFGRANTLNAGSIGKPGHRQFRVNVEAAGGAATIWLEKEQLFGLAITIKKVIEQVDPSEPEAEAEDPAAESGASAAASRGNDQTTLDFKVGKLAIGYDREHDAFGFFVHDIEQEDDELPVLSFWASRPQAEGLAEEALAVCAAGRPICPLCHNPMNPEGHVCPRHNGHGRP